MRRRTAGLDMQPEVELLDAQLGDVRRSKRAAAIVATLAARPERSIPEAFSDGSALDLAYRFLSNDKVEWSAVLAAHTAATWERAKSCPTILAIHDTTDIAYPRRGKRLRENLAGITSRTQGFFVHTSVLVGTGRDNEVLGAVGLRPFVHASDIAGDKAAKAFWRKQGGLMDNEANRWWEAIESVQKSAPSGVELIHVGDRETDNFSLYNLLLAHRRRFVLRTYRDRPASSSDTDESMTISAVLQGASWLKATRTVRVAARTADRPSKDIKTNPTRKERPATLSFRACRVQLHRPFALAAYRGFPATVAVNAVQVLERHPPPGEAAVHWILVTSEPIDSDDSVLAVVDSYQQRWCIEEFFKCLKSGCLFESTQLDSASALLRLLAVLMPVVTHLLRIRYMDRHYPEAPATTILDAETLAVVQQQHPECFTGTTPTVHQATRAIARLGGHLSRNGSPGWLTLARGTNALYFLVQGFRLAMQYGQRNGSNP
jgi:hypothetical protein